VIIFGELTSHLGISSDLPSQYQRIWHLERIRNFPKKKLSSGIQTKYSAPLQPYVYFDPGVK
jgi:hypothetical protein